MKKILLIPIFMSLLLLSNSGNSKALSTEQAISTAGSQRMLSQRIAKNYILISSRITPDEATEELDESAANFEMNLHKLKISIQDDAMSKKALQELNKGWREFREFALREPKRENTPEIVKRSGELLNLANNLVIALEFKSATKSAVLINISGRQRMLSQRLAMFYLAGFSGYNEDKYHEEMRDTAKEFSDALVYLIDIPENPEQIKTALNDVNNQWSFYQSRFIKKKKARYVPRVIQVITETILQDMDQVTELYKREDFAKTIFSESMKIAL
ncbi:type IV pili methyl-accepting chemotaxis transducer N-terminal domain-containing protein [Pseudoalteromonas denitrificans]|jgi:nitrate/nitrite-specific signal transduction histidine kinase|uniref:Type IV pili methyl-accepting chemotaxis transducer N-term n=1 Tax=Pseudoalteromonas denitrificans DSM 6059 TaxID=1123010 RepID=A0A1I1JY79_9GAMM|nr:type IV pili methyl-accepting chemotaxis transducer N-terminal domain-containing protein [Pseudoalteromonas denitrificans]SFC53446.1 Type IV pili methyl-accepting chemotaxis transducer N-term [Pseudoalteromonas denitrificans DSM 6059]